LSEDELETINGLTYNEAESYSNRSGSSNSAAAASYRTSADHQHSYGEHGHSYTHPQIQSVQSVLLTSSNSTKPSNDTSPRPDKPTFKCTYPGCTAVSFTLVVVYKSFNVCYSMCRLTAPYLL